MTTVTSAAEPLSSGAPTPSKYIGIRPHSR
jgi:hypothetical protein